MQFTTIRNNCVNYEYSNKVIKYCEGYQLELFVADGTILEFQSTCTTQEQHKPFFNAKQPSCNQSKVTSCLLCFIHSTITCMYDSKFTIFVTVETFTWHQPGRPIATATEITTQGLNCNRSFLSLTQEEWHPPPNINLRNLMM